MPYLVCYDISNNKKRALIAKTLKKHAYVRIQKSIFIGISSRPSRKKLKKCLASIMNAKHHPDDKCYILRVRKREFKAMMMLGARMNPALALGRDKWLIV